VAGDLDQVSQAIGVLQGKISSMETSSKEDTKLIFAKLEKIHIEQTNQKINTAKLSIKMGFITAVLTLGVVEGVRFYLRSHGGSS
jgi:hypothetical protein